MTYFCILLISLATAQTTGQAEPESPKNNNVKMIAATAIIALASLYFLVGQRKAAKPRTEPPKSPMLPKQN